MVRCLAPSEEREDPDTLKGAEHKAKPRPVDRTERGRCALEGTRTPNLLIRSQMLYPLSYERIAV